MSLYVARHAETTWNKEKRILGSAPGELSDDGKAQAEELAQRVASLGLGLALASDLKRVKDTCAPLAQRYPSLKIAFTSELRERNFGEWEGSLRKEVDWQGIWEGSSYEPELSRKIGAEPLHNFRKRLAKFVIDFNASYRDTDKTVLWVTSIGVMNSFQFFTDPDHFEFHDFPNAEPISFNLAAMAKNAEMWLKQ